ncbi:MAG: asparagine synthase (glutamine-hydrolyzing), partial [Gammaproteobacteria bacterium]
MCGISGWFSQSALEANADDRLQDMMRAINHRGPDADGKYRGDHVAFGHTRLSIIDLDSGQQPMTSTTGNTTIVFNGEIYNYKALRSACEHDGYRFRTSSDTEVILALFETQGIHAMRRLRGMFAFALWDSAKNEGWLVRDPLGIKPLFFSHKDQSHLVFASEAKSIFASGLCQRSLDTGSLHLLMNMRYLPGTQTLFEGVEQLPAGHALCWKKDGSTRLVPVPAEAAAESPDTVAAIRDSVLHHMVSDVEVGAYLSGGIDSATVVALAGATTSSPMQTFTLDIGDDPKEARNAARTAEILGVTNT